MKLVPKLAAISLLAMVGAAQAAPVTYLAADNNVSSLSAMVNSSAAAASFLSVAGALNTVDFESSAFAITSFALTRSPFLTVGDIVESIS